MGNRYSAGRANIDQPHEQRTPGGQLQAMRSFGAGRQSFISLLQYLPCLIRLMLALQSAHLAQILMAGTLVGGEHPELRATAGASAADVSGD